MGAGQSASPGSRAPLCAAGARAEELLSREVPRFCRKYELGAFLGAGTMGTVFACRRRETGEALAVKVCEKRGPKAAAVVNGLRSEALARGTLDGTARNLMRVVKTYETGGCAVQISERLQVTLRCGEVAYERGVVRTIVRGVVQGVAAMHGKGVAHLDIKADNVMLKCASVDHALKPEDAVLIDFGSCAHFTPGRGDIHAAAGSPSYCAPEMLRAIRADRAGAAVPAVSERVDIWSVGVLAYVLATGRFPFPARDPQELAAQHREPFAARAHRGLDPALADFLTQCFALDPAARPSADALLRHPYLNPAGRTPVLSP